MKSDRISVLLAASVVLTVISAVITHYAIRQSQDRVGWVFHTHLVIEQSNQLLSILKDAENGQRGYLITADSSYLKPFQDAEQELPITIDSLRNLVHDNAQQRELLHSKIIPLIDRRINKLRTTLDEYERGGYISARLTLKSNEGKKIMDDLRHVIATFTLNEETLLASRLEEVSATHVQQNIVRFTSFSIIGIVSILAWIALKKASERNENLLSQLQDANRTLETKVEERTLELEKKNQLNEKLNRDLQENFEELESFYEVLQMRYERTEDAAREVRDLYNNPLCGYHSIDANGIIIRMNKTELDWLGYTANEVLFKKHITEVFIEAEHKSYYDGFDDFKKQGFVRNKEHTFKRKDGSTFNVLVNSAAMYDQNGNYVMSRATLVDITEQKKVERLLSDTNQKLIHLNDEKNNFLSFAAHDLRSPINGILGLLNLMKLNGTNLTDDQREYIRHLEYTCSNMQTLITNLLDISRIEQGLNTITRKSTDMNRLIQQNIHNFREQALQKDILLMVDDQAPGTKIHTDPVIVHRILDNLVSNAIKFSPKGKEVKLKVTHQQTYLRIEVIDQGQGISTDERSKLFRKFQKLSARPTNGESSTGLGLSIVKELTEALLGRISVESEVNKGSTFILELPLTPAQH